MLWRCLVIFLLSISSLGSLFASPQVESKPVLTPVVAKQGMSCATPVLIPQGDPYKPSKPVLTPVLVPTNKPVLVPTNKPVLVPTNKPIVLKPVSYSSATPIVLRPKAIPTNPTPPPIPPAPDAPSPEQLFSGSKPLKRTGKGDEVMADGSDQFNRLVILIDENIFRPVETTVWQDLEDCLMNKSAPILCSLSFVYSCILESDNIRSGAINFDAWFIYKVPNSHLFLFIPKEQEDSGFNIKALEKDEELKQVIFDDEHFEEKGIDMRQSTLAKMLSLVLKHSPEVEVIGQDENGMSVRRFKHRVHQSAIMNDESDESGNSEPEVAEKYLGDFLSFDDAVIEFLLSSEKRSNDKKWNILWLGHGGELSYNIIDVDKKRREGSLLFRPHTVGGIATSQAQKVLTAFNELPVHTVSLVSCFSGGEHRRSLIAEDQLGSRFNYTLGILSGSDREVITFSGPNIFNVFFNEVEEGKGYYWFQRALFSFVKNINYIGNIPQVLVPGAEDFHIFVPAGKFPVSNDDDEEFVRDIARRIGSITQAKLTIKRFSPRSKPLHFDGHDIIAVYPDIIDQPVMVAPRVLENYFMQGQSQAKKRDYVKELKDDFYHHKTNHYGKTLNEVDVDLDLRQELIAFPAFESMNNEDGVHIFKSIELTDPAKKEVYGYYSDGLEIHKKMLINDYNPKVAVKLPGVFTFLTQAFLNLSDRQSAKIFFIKKLTGFNDFDLVSSDGQSGITKENQMERVKTTMEDVFIFTDPRKNKIIVCGKMQGEDSYKTFFMTDEGWSSQELTDEQVAMFYNILRIANPGDEELSTPSFDLVDFKKVEGYNDQEPLLLQLFDLWPQVQELRGQGVGVKPTEENRDDTADDLSNDEG